MKSTTNSPPQPVTLSVPEWLPEPLADAWRTLDTYPILQAAIIVVLAFIAAKIVEAMISRGLGRLTRRTTTNLDDTIIRALRRPVFLTVLFMGLLIATYPLGLTGAPHEVTVGILKSLLVIVWFRFGFSVSTMLLGALAQQSQRFQLVEARTIPLLDLTAKVLLFGGASYALLITWGINPTAWMASAGVLGLAVGFAAKDTLANLFAGFSILADAPYKIGDYVNLDSGERGRVTHVGIRSTRLLTRDDVEITLPNALIANAKIINESGGPSESERIRIKVGVAYGSDVDQVCEVLEATGKAHDHVCTSPEPRVRLRAFGDSSLDFELLCWIDEPVLRGKVSHELYMNVYKAFAEHGLEIPFPQRDLHVRTLPPGAVASSVREVAPRSRAAVRVIWMSRWRRLLVGQAFALVVAWLSYRLVGHGLVARLVARRAGGGVDPATESASPHPLGSYLGVADAVVSDLFVVAIAGLVIQIVILGVLLRAGPRPPRSSGEEQPAAVRAHPPSWPKRIAFGLFVATIPLGFVGLTYAVRLAQYRSGLEAPEGLEEGTYRPPPMPGLSPEQLLQVGYAQRSDRAPLHSYLNVPRAKAEGAFRIGLFGDSYAEGEEAALEHAITSHLERLLETAGVGEIEVVNFGVSGHGMSQAMLLWEYLGRHYELDLAIVMPFWFHDKRDTSFLFIDRHFGPLHGLYVLDGNTPRYVPVLGTDRLDSCRRYFRPVQAARYWRYDARMPMLFRPLMPNPHGQRSNPFYYRRDVDAATADTYRALFREVAREVGQLVVYTDDVLFPDLASLQSDSIHVLAASVEDLLGDGSSLYRAPRNHPSGLGYELYATELAALLLGDERPVFETLRVGGDLLAPQPSGTTPPSGGLGAVSEVRLSVAGTPIAGFQRREGGEPRWYRLNAPVDFAEEGVVSLAAHASDDGFLFVPVPFPLLANDEVVLQAKMNGEVTRMPVGRVINAQGVVGQLDIDWTRLEAEGVAAAFRVSSGNEFDVLEIACRGTVEEIQILIGERAALIGTTREPMSRIAPYGFRRALLGSPWTRTITTFRPAISRFIRFRGRAGEFIEVNERLAERGTIDLTWTSPDGEARVLPLLPYERQATEGPAFEPPYGLASTLKRGAPR